MKWIRVSSDPITTERRTLVQDADGRQGWCAVTWSQGHVRLGAVRDDSGATLDEDPEIVTEFRDD